MASNRVVEYVFFFGLLGVVGYLVWQIVSPFLSALALSAIIVTICYPLYERILARIPRQSKTAAALVTTLLVLVVIVIPVALLFSAVLREAVALYQLLGAREVSFLASLEQIEDFAQIYVPAFELNVTEYLRQLASWFASKLGTIFTGTASTLFSFFIAIIGTFYFFADGRKFARWLVRISPLPDAEDEKILSRLSRSVRAVTTGVLLIAIIQGILSAVGLAIFGFDRAVLLGAIAAIGALIPSVGTSIVLVPAVGYLVFVGEFGAAIGLGLWAALAVGLIDNLLAPYLIGRRDAMHPFVILIAVLGGIAFFGPIGFVVGPVVVSFFMVLLELYTNHVANLPRNDAQET